MSTDGSGSPLSAEQVERWLEQVDGSLVNLQARLEPLLEEQARLQERRLLLKELLASFGDRPSAMDASTTTGSASRESTRVRVHRQAVGIFEQVGRALHTNDLHAEFLRRGYEIPGAGKPNNITVHLTGWPDIASPERGVYGLVKHVVGPSMSPTPKRRKKRQSR